MPNIDAEQAYFFRHALLRDAAYELQVPTLRARLHALALEILKTLQAVPASFDWDVPETTYSWDSTAGELAYHASRAQAGANEASLAQLRHDETRFTTRAVIHAIHMEEYGDAARKALSLAERTWLEPQVAAKALIRAASCHEKLGANREALRILDRARELFVAEEQPELNLRHKLVFGGIQGTLGKRDAGRAALEEALAAAQLLGDKHMEMSICHALSNCALDQTSEAELLRGITHAKKSLELARALHFGAFECRAINNLANFTGMTGDKVRATQLHLDALAIARRMCSRRLESLVLGNLANNYRDTGRFDLAKATYEAAIALNQLTGDKKNEGIGLGNLARMLVRHDRGEEAEPLARRSLALHEDVGNAYFVSVQLRDLALIHRKRREFDDAERLLTRALEVANRVGDDVQTISVELAFARLWREQGKREAAHQLCEEVLALSRSINYSTGEASARGCLALLSVDAGDAASARILYEQACACYGRHWDTYLLEQFKSDIKPACAKAGIPPFDDEAAKSSVGDTPA